MWMWTGSTVDGQGGFKREGWVHRAGTCATAGGKVKERVRSEGRSGQSVQETEAASQRRERMHVYVNIGPSKEGANTQMQDGQQTLPCLQKKKTDSQKQTRRYRFHKPTVGPAAAIQYYFAIVTRTLWSSAGTAPVDPGLASAG